MPDSPSLSFTSGAFDTDDGITMQVDGESFPRVKITPQGSIVTGDGDATPANAGGIARGALTSAGLPAPSATMAWVDFSTLGLPRLDYSINSLGIVEIVGSTGYMQVVDEEFIVGTPTDSYRGGCVIAPANPDLVPRIENLTPLQGIITCETTIVDGLPVFGDFLPGWGLVTHDGSIVVGMADPSHNTFNIAARYEALIS